MDKIVKGNYNLSWRGVAWRGVRACFAYLLAALIVLSQVNITAFAAEGIEYFEGSTRNTKQANDVTTITAGTNT